MSLGSRHQGTQSNFFTHNTFPNNTVPHTTAFVVGIPVKHYHFSMTNTQTDSSSADSHDSIECFIYPLENHTIDSISELLKSYFTAKSELTKDLVDGGMLFWEATLTAAQAQEVASNIDVKAPRLRTQQEGSRLTD